MYLFMDLLANVSIPSEFIYLSIPLFTYSSVCLFMYVSIHLHIYLCIHDVFIYIFIYSFIHLSIQ